MKKRLFRILLALCMVLCLMPTTAFAGDDMTASNTALFCYPKTGKQRLLNGLYF